MKRILKEIEVSLELSKTVDVEMSLHLFHLTYEEACVCLTENSGSVGPASRGYCRWTSKSEALHSQTSEKDCRSLGLNTFCPALSSLPDC